MWSSFSSVSEMSRWSTEKPRFKLWWREKAEAQTSASLGRESLRTNVESHGEQKRKGLFGRLFSPKNWPDYSKTFVTAKTAPAEFGINTTLCAKTARNNAENIFGITDLPRGNAWDVLKSLSKTHQNISLDYSRNTTGRTQVAYVGIDVVDAKTKQNISHVALATKPNGGNEWFITDPYQGGQWFIRLRDYPTNVR